MTLHSRSCRIKDEYTEKEKNPAYEVCFTQEEKEKISQEQALKGYRERWEKFCCLRSSGVEEEPRLSEAERIQRYLMDFASSSDESAEAFVEGAFVRCIRPESRCEPCRRPPLGWEKERDRTQEQAILQAEMDTSS